ncbi:MAG: cytochrome c-type biogenesis protein [Pseudomonadota bacterium]
MRAQVKLIAELQAKFIAVVLMCFTLSLPAFSAIEAHTFDTDLERQRYQSFIEEMRCPKCQNQNLAGSDSSISNDLRQEIYNLIKAGKADQEIVDFMVKRYGDFILYRPRVSPVTYILWGAPVVLLIGGIVVLLIMLRQRRRLALVDSQTNLTDEEQARLAALLTPAVNKDQLKPGKNKPNNNKSKNN